MSQKDVEVDTIADGEWMKQVMDDDRMKRAFTILLQRATDRALNGATVDEREEGRAMAKACEKLAIEMRIVHDRGAVAKVEKSKKDEQERARMGRKPL